MAHFAELDSNNVVLRVVVIGNSDILDENGNESESVGIEFCQHLFNGGIWKQTSYNGKFRKNYAGIGYLFDEQRNAFIPKKDFASWVLDEEMCQWKPPINRPTDGKNYFWDEPNQNWDFIPDPPSEAPAGQVYEYDRTTRTWNLVPEM
jgi:hypothetical protein